MRVLFKKTANIFFFLTVLLSVSFSSYAERNFNFIMYGGANNFWSNTLFQFPASLISNITTLLVNDEQYLGGSYRYEIFNVKEAGNKIPMYKGRFFGFRAKDLFSDIQYGLKFGWAPEYSPVGLYVSCSYQFRRFEAEFAATGPQTYKLNSVRPGAGIRIIPLVSRIEDDGWSPLIEAGIGYNYYFNVKGAYNNSKKQFRNGLISTFGIGVRDAHISLTGGVEIDHSNLFDRTFTPDSGITFPYADVKTSRITVFISFTHEFH
ncbi:MAG: hypothetical protein K2H47_01535 [Muribaculaceae bacterium]|nr:hypothetical protein [Muribaculaceae bacterium]